MYPSISPHLSNWIRFWVPGKCHIHIKRESKALYKFHCVTLISQASLISRNSEQGSTLECIPDCTLDGALDVHECALDIHECTLDIHWAVHRPVHWMVHWTYMSVHWTYPGLYIGLNTGCTRVYIGQYPGVYTILGCTLDVYDYWTVHWTYTSVY